MLSQKHNEAAKVNYRSGFFITTNVLPDFGHAADQEAVYRRLRVFKTKALPKKDASVTGNIFSIHVYFDVFRNSNLRINSILNSNYRMAETALYGSFPLLCRTTCGKRSL